MEGWVDLGTAVVKVRSPCPRLCIAAAVAINTTVRGVVWLEPGSSHTAVGRANHSATETRCLGFSNQCRRFAVFCDNQLALSTASLQECQSRTSKRICSRALGILSICRSSFTHNDRRAVILRSAPSREGVYGLTKRCVLINGRCEPAARCIFCGLSLPCRLSYNTTTAVLNDQSCPWVHFIMCDPTQPNTDTIQDAILTCAWKPTWVSLIYRTEPTTKKWKTEELKSRKWICSEVTVNSPGNPCSRSWRRKRYLRWEGFAEKERFKPVCLIIAMYVYHIGLYCILFRKF